MLGAAPHHDFQATRTTSAYRTTKPWGNGFAQAQRSRAHLKGFEPLAIGFSREPRQRARLLSFMLRLSRNGSNSGCIQAAQPTRPASQAAWLGQGQTRPLASRSWGEPRGHMAHFLGRVGGCPRSRSKRKRRLLGKAAGEHISLSPCWRNSCNCVHEATDTARMEWFDLGWGGGNEPGGVLELPASTTSPGVALELHVAVGAGDRTVAFWMFDDGIFLAEVKPGCA